MQADNKLGTGFDPVTEADRAAERAMRDILGGGPADGILGEEYGAQPGTSLTWVLDPIDGTRGFSSGTPTWGADRGFRCPGPFYGIIDQPYIGERFEGRGWRAVDRPHGSHPLQTRAARDLRQAIVFTTFPEVGSSEEASAFAPSPQALLTRYGGLIATPMRWSRRAVDLVIEVLNAYDIQAPIAVIQAAGGIVTDWQGNPVHEGGRRRPRQPRHPRPSACGPFRRSNCRESPD